jgi:hypothetical protein
MADSKHPIFKEMFFVLDGDCREEYKDRKMPPRTIILPGTLPPEVIFYNFLNDLSDDDPFWTETDALNFSRQTCFQDHLTNDLSTAKRWFKNDEFKPFFGGTYAKLFKRWKDDNPEAVKKFQDDFKKMIENLK